MAHTHPLEGDSIQPNLFHYLWKKAPGLTTQKFKDLRIPDTIVFFNFPIVWYYWSESNGEVRKKAGQSLERDNIMKALCKRKDPEVCEVVASFLSHRADEEDKIYFFNEDELGDFLFHKTNQQGLLQKFVLPRGTHNEMIQAVWSPKLFYVTKRFNRHRLNDKHQSLNDRCITFEGPTYYTEEALSSPSVQNYVHKICDSFVEHFKSVEHHYTISRIVLYFKEDRKNGNLLWLMFSSSCRVTEIKISSHKPPLSLTPQFQGLYHSEEEEEQLKKKKEAAPVKRFRAGYLKNIRIEDMEILARAALNAGLADQDEGTLLGLQPLSELPLPSSLSKPESQNNTDQKKGVNSTTNTAPNDTIKSEMLLERIYFNNKTKQVRKNIMKCENENTLMALELKELQKQKLQVANGLHDLITKPLRLPNIQKSRSVTEITVGESSPLSETESQRHPSSHIIQHKSTHIPKDDQQTLQINKSNESEITFGLQSLEQRSPINSGLEASLHHSKSTHTIMHSPHEKSNDLLYKNPTQSKILGDLLAGIKEKKAALKVTKEIPEIKKEELNSSQEVDKVLKVVSPSIKQSFLKKYDQAKRLGDELSDAIYGCYNELSLISHNQHNGYYIFTLSQPIVDIMDKEFVNYMNTLQITRYKDWTPPVAKRITSANRNKERNSIAPQQNTTYDLPGYVSFVIMRQDSTTANEFQRFLTRVREYIVALVEKEENYEIENVKTRARTMSYVKLMTSIKGKGPKYQEHTIVSQAVKQIPKPEVVEKSPLKLNSPKSSPRSPKKSSPKVKETKPELSDTTTSERSSNSSYSDYESDD